MKKILITFVFLFSGLVTFSQNLTFKKLLYVAQNGNADTNLKAGGFTKGKDFNGMDVYTANAGTANEEQFSYDPRGSGYKTKNFAYMKNLEQQVKKLYKLILRDDYNQNEIYCEYGTPSLRIIFSFSKKESNFSRIDIVKH